jgi:hypothetical protein
VVRVGAALLQECLIPRGVFFRFCCSYRSVGRTAGCDPVGLGAMGKRSEDGSPVSISLAYRHLISHYIRAARDYWYRLRTCHRWISLLGSTTAADLPLGIFPFTGRAGSCVNRSMETKLATLAWRWMQPRYAAVLVGSRYGRVGTPLFADSEIDESTIVT